LLDWLAREGGIVLSWWLLTTLAGVAALPLCMRLLGGLPDRGYTLARAAGLLLVGFVFWLLASGGVLLNTTGDMLLAWLIVLGIGALVYFRAGSSINLRDWWRENRSVVIVGEILFIVLFFGWSMVRAHQNGLTGTEKPMELMFMNSVARSEAFPPNDAWMSGYAISYYYFGYVMSAMLSMLSGIGATMGFNLTISLLFALTGLTAFGVTYNLIRSRAFDRMGNLLPIGGSREMALVLGLIGMVFVVLLGNFQAPFVEIPYQTNIASESYLQFWDVDERQSPLNAVTGETNFDPGSWQFWWWFRAARVLNDLDVSGGHIEVIDEFPQFSFLLADTHPHVLALPFVMLAIGMALNLLLTRRDPSREEVVFYALCIGGLAFLNTWDGPVYLVALVGADGLRRLMRSGRLTLNDWGRLILLAVALLVIGITLYLPFWVGFRSQASGLLPNLINPTRTQQFFLMFGPFMLLLPPFLALEVWRGRKRASWGFALSTTGLLLLALLTIMVVMIGAASFIPSLRTSALNYVEESGGWGVVLPLLLNRRVEAILTTLLLLGGIATVLARLFPRQSARNVDESNSSDDGHDGDSNRPSYAPATGFALLLIGIGLVLALTPEFIYLRDNFSTRMNTIFKFYYQGWLVFSIASAYAIYAVMLDAAQSERVPGLEAVYGVLVVAVMLLGLTYPLFGVYSRMFVESGRAAGQDPAPLTLDGGRSFIATDDYESIMCLNRYISGDDVVVAEAIGPAYRSEYGRVGALTGIPVILGWENHQRQWRGATYDTVAGSRSGDITALYESPTWGSVQPIISRYGIDFIFYGNSERSNYGVAGEQKFRDNLEVACEFGNSRFYRVRPELLTAARQE
jgi:YYY domain-containing protein